MTIPASFDDWLIYLERERGESNIDLSLKRVKSAWQLLGAPKLAKRVITISGTNGKGSTARLIAAVAAGHGQKAAVYSSPHVFCFTERLWFSNTDNTSTLKTLWQKAFCRIYTLENAHLLTYYEYVTLAALLIISEQNTDLAVLEVGLGGRLDAVNIIDADIAVITQIAKDHEAFLGSCLYGIAREKAGICRPGQRVFIGSETAFSFLAPALNKYTVSTLVGGRDFKIHTSDTNHHWQAFGQTVTFKNMLGLYSENIALALAVIRFGLRITLCAKKIESAFLRCDLPARYQTICKSPEFIIDAAHNIAGVKAFSERFLSNTKENAKLKLFVGFCSDKAWQSALAPLLGQDIVWMPVEIPTSRSVTTQALTTFLESAGEKVHVEKNIQKMCYQVLASSTDNDRIAAVGSFYLANLFQFLRI